MFYIYIPAEQIFPNRNHISSLDVLALLWNINIYQGSKRLSVWGVIESGTWKYCWNTTSPDCFARLESLENTPVVFNGLCINIAKDVFFFWLIVQQCSAQWASSVLQLVAASPVASCVWRRKCGWFKIVEGEADFHYGVFKGIVSHFWKYASSR